MSIQSLFTSTDPVNRNRFMALACVTAATLISNLFGLHEGITVVYSHLLYFPLILAGYWYPKRGIPFAAALAAAYGIMAFTFYPPDPLATVTILSRCTILVVIGSAVSILSSRLRESERQFQDIIEFLPDPTFAINPDGNVIAWNQAIEKMTGISKSEMLNRGNYEYALPFYHERRPILVDLVVTPDPVLEARYAVLKKETGRLVSEVFIPHFHNGQGAHLRIAATPLTDPDGRVTGAIESIRDVTEQVMTESALKNTGSRLNILAGIIRNDIAKKLSVLYGNLSIGAMKFDDPDVITFIGTIRDSAEGIQRQVEISRVFRDLGTAPPAWVQVQDAVAEAAGHTDFGAVGFRAWVVRLDVFADPHIATAFYHLFEQTLRDTRDLTKVIVTYHIGTDGCRILIEDDGKGVPDTIKGSLFTRRNEVYGCGLYLAHEILTITGIAIRETGTPGKGTRFEILVPPEGYRIINQIEKTVVAPVASDSPRYGDPPGVKAAGCESLQPPRELRSDEFSLADEVWRDYHETTGNPLTDRIFAVFCGGTIVSLARCRRHPDGLEVDGIYTPEAHRRKGYSHACVRALVEACHNDDLYMHAIRSLTGFYGGFGFTPINERDLPWAIRERYLWAAGNLEGADVQPMVRKAGL